MTQTNGGFTTQPAAPVVKARNDVYTLLLIIGTIFVLAATVYMGYVCYDHYGTILPPSAE